MLSLTLASEKSLIEELWEYFVDKYFSADLPYLENFNVQSRELMFYKLIIIGICIGIAIAAICNMYNKRYLGDFVRKVIAEKCLSPDTAKTLSELGYQKSFGVRAVIKTGGSLSRWIRCVEEDRFYEEMEKKRELFEEEHKDDPKPPNFKETIFKRNVDTMHFYIPEERKYKAEIKFDDEGAKWPFAILVVVVSIIICLFLCYMLSDIIKLIDNFISIMS